MSKRYRYPGPEYLAAQTKGVPLLGKITFKQYELLVRKGYDGDTVRKWTKYHASREITKLLGGDSEKFKWNPVK
jgi:hypothetical protein